MNELSDSNPVSEEEKLEDQAEHSPWTMLVTMSLMIIGFLFAGVLLAQQSLRAKTAAGEPIFALSVLIEKGKTLTARPPAAETSTEEAAPARSSPFDGFKEMVMSQSSSDTIKWPRLKVTGFGKSADDMEKFAIINGNLIHPGEFAGKVKLVEVRAHDVVVEYKGERRTLTIDLED